VWDKAGGELLEGCQPRGFDMKVKRENICGTVRCSSHASDHNCSFNLKFSKKKKKIIKMFTTEIKKGDVT